jgi:hypothetical protein
MIHNQIGVEIHDQGHSERLQMDPDLTLEKAKKDSKGKFNGKLYTNSKPS